MSSTVLASFLYETKTISQRFRCTSFRSMIRAKIHHQRRHVFSEAKDSPFSEGDSDFIQDKAKLVARQLDWSAKSSMTKSERRAIERALRLISSQNEPQKQETQSKEGSNADATVDEILQIFASSVEDSDAKLQDLANQNPSQSQSHKIENISNNNDIGRADQASTDSTHFQSESIGLFEYLAQMRRGRSEKATVEGSTGDDTIPCGNITQRHDADENVNEVVRAYMTEFSQACKSAINSKTMAGDIALWKVIEDRIFSLIQVFQFNKPARETAKNQIPRQQMNSDSDQQSGPKDTALETITTASIPVVTRLYPASLLLSLRLFTKYFPTSPFPNALLPHIRSLGPTSYILGANTHFYNDLISFKWSVYSNLREINSLLAEMERWGVPFDTGTYKALMRISEDRWDDLHRAASTADTVDKGRGKIWWERPDHVVWLARVSGWRKMIARRLEEQGAGEVVREGVFRDMEENDHYMGNGRAVPTNSEEQMKEQTVWI